MSYALGRCFPLSKFKSHTLKREAEVNLGRWQCKQQLKMATFGLEILGNKVCIEICADSTFIFSLG